MKAKCPYCQDGCEKCSNGFIEASFKKDGKYWTRVCQNRKECGFVNGGHWVDEGFPLESSGACIICGSPIDWMLLEEAPDDEAWKKPENYIKWQYKAQQETVAAFREDVRKLRSLAMSILNGKTEFSLDDCRLLDICRICRKEASGPLTLNYGEEYAHTDCLKKDSKSA